MNKIKLKKKRKCDGAILVHIKNEISGERHTEVMKTTIVWENFMQMYAKKHGLQRKQLRFLFQTHNKSGLFCIYRICRKSRYAKSFIT